MNEEVPDNVQSLWSTGKVGKPEPRKRKSGNLHHPRLGQIYAGVYDRNKQRTTLNIGMEVLDRIREYNAKWKGTPFETPDGLVRHAVVTMLMLWDEMGEDLPPEMVRWMKLEQVRARAEQDARLQEVQDTIIAGWGAAWEVIWQSGDRNMLAAGLRGAREALEAFSPTQREKAEELIDRYEGRLSRGEGTS